MSDQQDKDNFVTDENGKVILNKDGSPRKKAGRPKGSRNMGVFRGKINAKYLRNLKRHFDQHGEKAIERVFEEKPDVYLKLMAELMPKQTEATVEDVTDNKRQLSELELANALASILARGHAAGIGEPGNGERADMDADTGASDRGIPH